VTTPPRDELRSPELLSSTRGRLAVAGFVVLAVAVVVIAALRPDRQGVGTPAAGASPSAVPTTSPSESPVPVLSPQGSPSPLPPPPVPPRLTAKTGARLLVVQGTRLQTLDVDAGRVRALPRTAHASDYDRLDVVAVDGQLVLVGDNNTGAGSGPFPAYATTAGPGSRLRALGEASYLLPSEHSGRVWLAAVVDTNDATAGTTLTEVDLSGRVHQRAHFRYGAQPFAGGFLRQAGANAPGDAGDQGTDLVDAQGRVLHNYAGRVVLVTGNTAILSLTDAPCSGQCRLQVLTAGATIEERTVTVAALPGLSELGLSRDGSRLFTSDIVEGGSNPPSWVTELDLRTGRVHRLTDAWAETYYGASFVFSADGRWMFFSDVDAKHVDAYDLTTRRAFRVPGTFGTITQLELLAG
jgi:hypothetical protein